MKQKKNMRGKALGREEWGGRREGEEEEDEAQKHLKRELSFHVVATDECSFTNVGPSLDLIAQPLRCHQLHSAAL